MSGTTGTFPPDTGITGTGARDVQVTRLYDAVFDRAPDAGGLAFWTAALNRGVTLDTVADLFVRSSEFQSRGALGNADFVNLVYRNGLERTAETSGLNFWTNDLQRNAIDRGGVALAISESPEGLASPLAQGTGATGAGATGTGAGATGAGATGTGTDTGATGAGTGTDTGAGATGTGTDTDTETGTLTSDGTGATGTGTGTTVIGTGGTGAGTQTADGSTGTGTATGTGAETADGSGAGAAGTGTGAAGTQTADGATGTGTGTDSTVSDGSGAGTQTADGSTGTTGAGSGAGTTGAGTGTQTASAGAAGTSGLGDDTSSSLVQIRTPSDEFLTVRVVGEDLPVGSEVVDTAVAGDTPDAVAFLNGAEEGAASLSPDWFMG